MKKLSLKLSVLLGITVVALIALGVSGWFYSAHALPRTSLAGQSISSLSQQQVEDQLRQRVDSAKVTLTVAEQTREASLSDLGISVDVPATVDAAFSENRSLFSRFRGLFRSRSITPVVNFDQSMPTSRSVMTVLPSKLFPHKRELLSRAPNSRKFSKKLPRIWGHKDVRFQLRFVNLK